MKRITLLDKAFLLKKTPLFGTLDLDLLLPIADKLELIDYDKGEVIFSAKDQAHRMYLIIQGTVALKNSEGVLLTELKAPGFFGDEAIFNEQPRAYSAISQTDALLLTLSRTHLLTIISECPSVAVGFLQVYSAALPFRKS